MRRRRIRGLFFFLQGPNPLNSDWQRHVLASSGYLELGMFDDAALALEEIEPEDKTREEVLGARVAIYIAARNGTWRQRSQSSRERSSLTIPTGGSPLPLQCGAARALRVRKPCCSGPANCTTTTQ